MQSTTVIKKKLDRVFDKRQATVLAEVIEDAYSVLVKTSDFNELKGIVKELAEAQKESEKKLTRVEVAVEELAEAQRRTEESLNRLVGRVGKVEDRLEGVSNSVGYSLENMAYKSLPSILKQEDIKVIDRMKRRYYKGRQINIFAEAKRDGKDILILGEAKVRPSKIEIDKFLKIVEKVKKEEVDKEIYLIFVAHDYHPNTEIFKG